MIYPITESLKKKTIKMFKITEEEMKSYKPGRFWFPLSRRWGDDPTADRDDIDHSTDEEVELTPVMLLGADLIDRPTLYFYKTLLNIIFECGVFIFVVFTFIIFYLPY